MERLSDSPALQQVTVHLCYNPYVHLCSSRATHNYALHIFFSRLMSVFVQIIKERVATTFLPTGPLHMLPPGVLDSLKLSTKECNEVLTVAVAVDYETGICCDVVLVVYFGCM